LSTVLICGILLRKQIRSTRYKGIRLNYFPNYPGVTMIIYI